MKWIELQNLNLLFILVCLIVEEMSFNGLIFSLYFFLLSEGHWFDSSWYHWNFSLI